MGTPASKEVPHNPDEEKKEAIELSKADADGTANQDENQSGDSEI